MSAAVKRAVAAAKTRRLLKKWNGVKTTPTRDADEPRDDEPASNPPAPALSKKEQARWLRDRTLAESKLREASARAIRETELAAAREACTAERAAVTVGCGERRERVRSKARASVSTEQQERASERKAYSRKRKDPALGLKRGQLRYSQAESDSLALAAIPARLHRLWTRERRRFPITLQPDARAERFMEWAETSEAEEALRLEGAIDPRMLAKAEAEHYREQLEAVPF